MSDIIREELLKKKLDSIHHGSTNDTISFGSNRVNSLDIFDASCAKIVFIGTVFQGQFRFSRAKNEKIILEFENCEFESGCILANTTVAQLAFKQCSGENLLVNNSTVSENIVFDSCASFRMVILNDIITAKISLLYNSNSRFVFCYLNCGTLVVKNNKENFSLFIDGLQSPGELGLENKLVVQGRLNVLDIFIDFSFKGILSIENNIIESFILKGKLDNAAIDVANNDINSVVFHSFINNGSVKFSRCRFNNNSELTVFDSDLGKARVFYIDFTYIDNVYISESRISDILYSFVTWCREIKGEKNNELSFGQKREVYRQLKNVATNHNDKPIELKFYELEMNAYQGELCEIGIQKPFKSDLFILRFNKWSNNHGISWLRPLIIILVLVVLQYFIIKNLLGFTHLNLSPPSMLLSISEILECFNPVRKFSDSFGLQGQVPDTWQAALAKIFDILFLRIVMGLLIFQMVKAFRKYVR